jgi:hypothetical protein
MQLMKSMWVSIALVLIVTLTSCGPGNTPEPAQDANAIYTSVAGTMVAQLNDQQTQTAQAVPPTAFVSPTPPDTNTPLPTFPVTPLETPVTINMPSGALAPTISSAGGTPSTGAGCYDSKFITESEPADGTQFSKEQNFSKSWTFQNTGTCTWVNSFTFGFQSGDRMAGKNIVISRSVDYTLPGNNHTFTVYFEAPNAAGHYIGFWQMRTPEGGSFGSRVWVDIVVK